MRVIVTRPQNDAPRWVRALQDQGIEALALPLIAIRPVAAAGSLIAAWQTGLQCDAIMFVSTPAVDHFFAARPQGLDTSALAAGPRFWAPGPGTRAALVRHGVAAQRIDAPAPDGGQFDSEALWQIVAGQVAQGSHILIVRGASHDVTLARLAHDVSGDQPATADGQGREWLANQLRLAGAVVRFAVAYWRAAPEPLALQKACTDNAIGEGDLWLFTSSQAIGYLADGLPAQDWSRARALATHPRIATTAREAGFGVVSESRPALADIIASIKSLR